MYYYLLTAHIMLQLIMTKTKMFEFQNLLLNKNPMYNDSEQ